MWWLYTFFAIATYTANMGAFLTISRMVKDIDSFEYLQKQNRMRQQSNICYNCVYLINVSLVSLPSMGLNIKSSSSWVHIGRKDFMSKKFLFILKYSGGQ